MILSNFRYCLTKGERASEMNEASEWQASNKKSESDSMMAIGRRIWNEEEKKKKFLLLLFDGHKKMKFFNIFCCYEIKNDEKSWAGKWVSWWEGFLVVGDFFRIKFGLNWPFFENHFKMSLREKIKFEFLTNFENLKFWIEIFNEF